MRKKIRESYPNPIRSTIIAYRSRVYRCGYILYCIRVYLSLHFHGLSAVVIDTPSYQPGGNGYFRYRSRGGYDGGYGYY
jgi:hypothetical protein